MQNNTNENEEVNTEVKSKQTKRATSDSSENSTRNATRSDKNSSDINTNDSNETAMPPAKPTDTNGNETEPPEINCTDGTDCETPEPPDGFDGEMPLNMQDMKGGRFIGQTTSQVNSDAVLHPVGYLAIGGVSVILGILISYMCFSRFFRQKPGETFSSLKKFIWFIAVALMIAVGLIVLGYFIPIWCK